MFLTTTSLLTWKKKWQTGFSQILSNYSFVNVICPVHYNISSKLLDRAIKLFVKRIASYYTNELNANTTRKITTVADRKKQIAVRSTIPIKEWSPGNLWNTKLGSENRYHLKEDSSFEGYFVVMRHATDFFQVE